MIQPLYHNRREYGRSRDTRIAEWIRLHTCATAEQIAEVFFQSVACQWRLKKCRERLRLMVSRGYIKTFYYWDGSLIYTVRQTRNTPKVGHYLAVNRVILGIRQEISEWERMEYWLERRIGDLIPDIYLVISNPIRKTSQKYYIEVENEDHSSLSEKLAKYTGLLMEQEESKLVVVYKHKWVAEELQGTRFIKQFQGRIYWCELGEKIRRV